MNVLYENVCFYTKRNLLEMAKKTVKRGYIIWCVVLILTCSIVGIAAITIGNNLTIPGSVLLVGAILIAYLVYMAPRKASLTAYKRNMELYHSEVETRTIFYEDYFIGKNLQAKS